jgi:hypothetical protein
MTYRSPVVAETTIRCAIDFEESISVSVMTDETGRASIVIEAVQESAFRPADAFALLESGCNVARLVVDAETAKAIAKAIEAAVATYSARTAT